MPRFRLSKVLFWLLLSIPLCILLNDIRIELGSPTQGLGADPEDAIVDHLGIWAIRMLWFTLFISSLSRVIKKPVLVQYRRMAGLWAFFMVLLHLSSYVLLLARGDFMVVIDDFVERPYIIAGITGLSMLLPLAITSTRGWRRRLGLNWKRLHRLVYVAAIAGWIHLFWLERASIEESVIYGVLLLVLFGERVFNTIVSNKRRTAFKAVT